jgi:hypothetical protein
MQSKETFMPQFMPSLIWNTNPAQMMAIVVITMKMVNEMEEVSNLDEYWIRLGFIKE